MIWFCCYGSTCQVGHLVIVSCNMLHLFLDIVAHFYISIIVSCHFDAILDNLVQHHCFHCLWLSNSRKCIQKVIRNCTYIYTQFDAQNTGNSVSELPDAKLFWGACPETPLAKAVLWPLVNTVTYSSQTGYFKLY